MAFGGGAFGKKLGYGGEPSWIRLVPLKEEI